MMRVIRLSKQFKRDYKRFRHDKALDAKLRSVVSLLAADAPLDQSLCDHALHNNWEGCRDCHLRPDVVLIYEKTDQGIAILRLLRMGSHSELF